MPPPPDRLQDIWARTIEESPDLRDRWGGATEFPIDDQGNIDRDALRDLLSATRGREVPQKSYAVTPPRPVDWGQRIKDLTGAVRFLAEPGRAQIGGLLGTTPFAKFIPGIEPAKAIQAPEKWNTVGALSTALSATGQIMEPISKGLQAIDEIVAPARGMAFGGWVPGLTKPGVQARSRALREQGFGPWASAGAAYEQSVEAGEIPWWQRLPAEILTDPVELAPGIGIGPGIAKLGYRGLTGLTKAVVPKVAKEAVEAVPGSVPGRAAPTAPADARAAVPGDVPRRVPVEEAAKLAEVRAIGPRAKIAILEERHREALEAIRNLEARIPQAQRQLDIPTTRPAAPAAARAAGLTPDEATELGRLKGHLANDEAALEDLLNDPEAIRRGLKPRPYSVRYPGRQPGTEGYRPPTKPGYTEADRLQNITYAEDAVTVAKGEVADAKKAVDKTTEYLNQNQARLLKEGKSGKEEITSLKEDISDAKSNHTNAKSNLTDAGEDLRQAKQPTVYTAEEKAYIAAADKLDVEVPRSLRASIQRAQKEIAELEARQATPAPTVPQLSTKTGALRDRIIRNDAEFFLETVDDQLAVVRSTEKSARIALQDAQARVRGRFAKEALAQRDVEIGRGILSPAAPAVRQVADVPAAPAVRQAADVPPTAAAGVTDVPGAVGIARAEIDDIISRVPETSINPRIQGKRSATNIVRRNFDELLAGGEVKNRAAKVSYIARQTGRSKEEIEGIIRRGSGEPPVPSAANFTSETADEFLTTAFKEDPGSWLAEKLAGLPGFEAVMSRVFTPASIARRTGNEAVAEGYAYRGMQTAQEASASSRLGEFTTTTVSGVFGRPIRLFDVAMEGSDRGKILLRDGTRAAFGDVAQNPTAFLNRGQIDNAQHKWITDAHRYIDELARNYQLVSGKKLIFKWANVEHYWPRFVEKADGSTGIVKEAIFAKQSPSAKRVYETMQDGMDAGKKYVPDPFNQLDFYSKAVSKMTRDAIFEKRLLTKQIKLPDGTTVAMATRRKLGEKIDPEKMPSWQSRRSWKDIDITDEAKRQLAQPLGVRGGAFLSTAEMVAAVPKFIMAGLFDTGMFMLQGMSFMYHDPVGWSRAVRGALETLFARSPEDYYNQWIRTGYAEKIKDASAHGLDTKALSEWYQIGQSGLGGLGRVPVLGKPTAALGQRFGAAFHAFINTGRIEMYDAIATVARKKIRDPVELERELHRIGRIAESLMGGTSTKGLGLSSSQRQLENAWIFFAPRYTRAVFATVAHAALGKGVGANETRKILAKMMFGTTLIVAGVVGALGVRAGKSQEEIKDEILLALNPKSGAAFMAVNIAGHYYGLGGGYRALTSLIANTAGVPGPGGKPNSWQYMMQGMERKGGLKEPKAWVELALGNPFVSFWRTKSSVLTGTIADFIDGEDFVGEEFGIGAFVKDPTLFAAALRRRTTPFPVESFIEVLASGSGVGTAVAAGGLEFLGGRYVEESIGRRITTIEDQMVENTFGRGDHPDYPGVIYTKMLDLEKAAEKGEPTVTQKNIVERDPKNKALMEEKERLEGQYPAAKTGVSKMYDEIAKKQDERMAREVILVDTYVKRLDDPSAKKANDPYAFRVGLAKSSSKFTTSKDVIEQVYKAEEPGVAQWLSGREPDRLKEPQSWTIFKFFQIREESRDPLGEMDHDKFEESWAEEQASWGEDSGLSELFENWQREYVGERNPIVQQYYDDQKVLSNVGYWQDDFPEITSRLQKSYSDLNVEGIWKAYLDADDTNRRNIEKSLDTRVRNIIRILKSTRDNHRTGLRQANQEVDRIRVKWYRQKPLHRQNMALWNQLYVSQ